MKRLTQTISNCLLTASFLTSSEHSEADPNAVQSRVAVEHAVQMLSAPGLAKEAIEDSLEYPTGLTDTTRELILMKGETTFDLVTHGIMGALKRAAGTEPVSITTNGFHKSHCNTVYLSHLLRSLVATV